MNKTIFSFFIVLMFSVTQSFAQENNKNFVFLGGTTSIYDQHTSNLTLGVEGVYMRKIWRGLAIGAGANIDFGLPSVSGSGSVDAFDNGTVTHPAYDYENKRSFQKYSISALVGGVFDHSNGSRTALLVGPEYGKIDFKTNFNQTFADGSSNKSSNSRDEDHFSLRAGVYHQFKDSQWIVGLNARYGFLSDFSDVDHYMQVGLSAGYAF
ncbi:porin family protein [Pseudemcibacter aquimaris]|uniref:porin family protein n=1 Tax=Pseudemcibacter aquimaris TaxID=2857064 RepID=UPI002011231A|nr:porin family protein [Pseudemcibacter aquimaris]MCC3859683.1 porin family protein [Pseudemcibacter aquimaris]WDU60078.1 porin family protein [Pseudemcibacter aquimaris]